jgi:diguanylate cyclase (GGDEF)-like protein
MAAAVSPAIFVALLKFDAIYVATSVILFAFFLGGVHTILTRYSAVKAEIGKRLTFGTLARQDGLTALPNRLALREYFDENASLSAPQRLVAVHYLDLDGFKPVNDSYGHSTGDALLAAVAERLNGVIRNGDIVARLGGDEFALLQFGLNRPEEAQIMSRRANGALEQPFMIGGHHIHISVSIGTVTRQVCNSDLDEMLALADRQLYIAKRLRSEVGERAA